MTRGQQLKVSVYDVTKGECAMVPLRTTWCRSLPMRSKGIFI